MRIPGTTFSDDSPPSTEDQLRRRIQELEASQKAAGGGLNERISALLRFYDAGIAANGVEVRHWANPITKRERLEHLRWMIAQMLLTPEEAATLQNAVPGSEWSDRKVNRWLGFIQGTLQAEGMVSIPMLRDQSRDLYPE